MMPGSESRYQAFLDSLLDRIPTARLLLLSMPSLMLAICVDVYLVTQVIVGSRGVSLGVAIATGAMFTALWFVLPRTVRL